MNSDDSKEKTYSVGSKCKICYKPYKEVNANSIACGHVFCFECILNIVHTHASKKDEVQVKLNLIKS